MNALVPTNWRDSMENLRHEVDEKFRHWISRFRGGENVEDGNAMDQFPVAFFSADGPPIDVENRERDILVRAELPGLDRKDFDVEVSSGRLVIRGEKKASWEGKRGDAYWTECSYGSFARAIPMPFEVDPDQVKAKFRNGVLEVSVNKPENARTRRVQVTSD